MSARAKRGGTLPRVWDSPLTIAVIIVGARVARQPVVRLTRDFYGAVPLHVLLNQSTHHPIPSTTTGHCKGGNGSLQGRRFTPISGPVGFVEVVDGTGSLLGAYPKRAMRQDRAASRKPQLPRSRPNPSDPPSTPRLLVFSSSRLLVFSSSEVIVFSSSEVIVFSSSEVIVF